MSELASASVFSSEDLQKSKEPEVDVIYHEAGKEPLLVSVECIDNTLYIDGKKVVLHSTSNQRNPDVPLKTLRLELVGQHLPGMALLHYLLKNTHLIPGYWKGDVRIPPAYIFFLGDDPSKVSHLKALHWHHRDRCWVTVSWVGNKAPSDCRVVVLEG